MCLGVDRGPLGSESRPCWPRRYEANCMPNEQVEHVAGGQHATAGEAAAAFVSEAAAVSEMPNDQEPWGRAQR